MNNNRKKFNQIYQDLLRKIAMFGVLSTLLIVTSKITNWRIMEYAGFAGVICTFVLFILLIYVSVIKKH